MVIKNITAARRHRRHLQPTWPNWEMCQVVTFFFFSHAGSKSAVTTNVEKTTMLCFMYTASLTTHNQNPPNLKSPGPPGVGTIQDILTETACIARTTSKVEAGMVIIIKA